MEVRQWRLPLCVHSVDGCGLGSVEVYSSRKAQSAARRWLHASIAQDNLWAGSPLCSDICQIAREVLQRSSWVQELCRTLQPRICHGVASCGPRCHGLYSNEAFTTAVLVMPQLFAKSDAGPSLRRPPISERRLRP